MQAIALFVSAVGRLNAWVGKTFAWLAPLGAMLCFAVVVQRYLFSTTQLWLQDLYVWVNGAMFMAVAGYTLLIDGHVRVDILYRPASPRRKAGASAAAIAGTRSHATAVSSVSTA